MLASRRRACITTVVLVGQFPLLGGRACGGDAPPGRQAEPPRASASGEHAKSQAPAQGETDVARGPLPKGVLAIVNGEAVTLAQLIRSLLHEQGKQASDRLIWRCLIQQEAKRRGVTVTREEVQATLREHVERRTKDPKRREAWEAELRAFGMTLDDYRRSIEPRARHTLLIDKLVGLQVTVRDAEVEWLHRKLYGKKVWIQKIAVSTRSKAEAILRKLKRGASFAELARESSICPSCREGGAVPALTKGQLPPYLEGVAFSLAPGQVSGVIRGPKNFHLLKLTRSEPQKQPLSPELRRELKKRLFDERVKRQAPSWLSRLRKEASITIAEHPF